ncbi:MAG: metal-dependent hydrolase [Deltaproteobacteria bacterium]|nr:metal-dependent hydrolase [Deltaproteobacteria bacterium]
MTPNTQTHSAPQPPRPRIAARRPELPFEGGPIPRHWFGGSALATHIINGVNLLFPDGERMFVKSVRYYKDAIANDPMLAKEAAGFYAQEGSHAREHQRFFEILRDQGYPVDDILVEFRASLRFFEKVFPPAFHLSATAAAEHFTAIMANHALTERVLDEAHPTVRHLLLWHATEEIEHKAVAFDVLAKVEPSYLVRVVGMAFAALFLAYWWQRATRMFLRHDGIGRAALRAEREKLKQVRDDGGIVKNVFLAGIKEYLKPGFHPWDRDDLHLAQEYLAETGMDASPAH